jgi:ketosteroid isomerase-like protein
MKAYTPGTELIVFDVTPPRQQGFDAYKKGWQEFFAGFPGPSDTFELTDLSVTTEGKLGYGHSIQHVVATGKDGKKTDFTVRVTDCYRQIDGKWLITHEHVSVPVDLATGKADLASKP